MDASFVARAAGRRLGRRPAGSRREVVLRAFAAALTAALITHLGMLLQAPHAPAAVGSPAAAGHAAADGHEGDAERTHAMVITCVVVLSLVLAGGGAAGCGSTATVVGAQRRRGAPAPGAAASRRAPLARGPTRVDAGVVLRV